MKPYKIRKTLVQEFVSFGNSREEAIANFEYSQGYDFDQVTINGDTYANGEVVDGKVTATPLGKGNFITFNRNDWRFAKAMWQICHEDIIQVREHDGTRVNARDIGNSGEVDEATIDKIIEIAQRYRRGSVTPVK